MKKILTLFITIAMLLVSLAVVTGAKDVDGVVSSHAKLPFEDIEADSWYADGLSFCYTNKIISGAGNTYTFNPKGQLTRATFAVMLARAIGADLEGYNSESFSDCDYSDGSWYAAAVEWAYSNEYMQGTGNGRFSPSITMTREQLATVFMRFMMRAEYTVDVVSGVLNDYTDKDNISSWAYDGVEYAVSAGLISSTSVSNKVASPDMAVTRDQAVKLFTSFLRTYFYGSCEHKFSEAACTVAPTCSECGMAEGLPNGHRCDILTCNVGGTCKVCGENVEPDIGLHIYPMKATCDIPEICSICGETRTEALGHSYSKATCSKLSTCIRCGDTRGQYAAHDMYNGVCKVCGYAHYDVFIDFVKSGYGNENIKNTGDQKFISQFMINEENGKLWLFCVHLYNIDDSFDCLVFEITKGSTEVEFYYEFCNANAEILFAGIGYLDATTFDENTVVTFYDYDGSEENAEIAAGNVVGIGDVLAEQCNDIIKNAVLGVKLSDIGFSNYR